MKTAGGAGGADGASSLFSVCEFNILLVCMCVCVHAPTIRWILFWFDLILLHTTDVSLGGFCVAVATAAHWLSNAALLMISSSSQTITWDTWSDWGNMSSLFCQEGPQADDDAHTPTVALLQWLGDDARAESRDFFLAGSAGQIFTQASIWWWILISLWRTWAQNVKVALCALGGGSTVVVTTLLYNNSNYWLEMDKGTLEGTFSYFAF